MQKIILILALAMLYNSNAGAKDRDCVRYTAEEAKEAIGESESTSFTAVFTHASGRIGNTNTGCLASDSPYVREDVPARAYYGGRLLVPNMNEIFASMGIDFRCRDDSCSGDVSDGTWSITMQEICDSIHWYKVNPDGGEDILQENAGASSYPHLLYQEDASPLPEGSYYGVFTDKNNKQYRTQIMEVPAPQE